MAAGPGSAPVNRLPTETTIGLTPGGSHDFAPVLDGDRLRYAIQVGDSDAASPETANLTVRLSVEAGAISFASDLTGLGGPSAGQVEQVTLTGSIRDINDALLGLTYHAPDSESVPESGVDRLQIETWDGIRRDNDAVTIRITGDGDFAYAAPINRVPEVTIPLDADGVHVFGGSSDQTIQVEDPKGNWEGDITVALSVEYGWLTFAFDPGVEGEVPDGVTVSGGGGSWALSGSLAAVNQALVGLEYNNDGMSSFGTDELVVTTTYGNLTDIDQIPFNIVHTLTPVPEDISYEDSAADDDFLEECGYLETSVDYPEFVLVGGTWIETGPEESGLISEGGSESEEPIFDQMQVGEYGTLYVDSWSGAYRYVPNDTAINGAKAAETDPFEIAVYDRYEGYGLYEEESGEPAATAVLAIAIAGANDTPTLSASLPGAHYMDSPGDDTFAGQGGTLSSTDRDLDDDPTFGVVGAVASTSRPGFDRAAQGEYGTLYMDSATGTYLYEPDDAAFERLKSEVKDTFTLTVTDESGATVTQAYTATIVGRNDRPLAPVAEPIYAASGDQALAIPAASGILAHATDRDGDPLTAVLLSGPSHGVLALQPDGSFVYTPQAGFSGADSFLVEASDGDLASTPIRVTLHVGAATPLAADDVLAVSEDRSSLDARSYAGNVLANDAVGTSPAAGAALVTSVGEAASAVGQVVQGRYGTLVLRADGSYTYTLSNTDALIAGETGVERFAYAIATPGGLSDAAVLEIRVQGEDLEILRPGAFSAHRGADRIGGSEGEDRLAGRAGDDVLAGLSGDDLIWGEDGNDTLLSGEGADQAVGGAGDDGLWLGAGDDHGWGEAGRDAIHGEAGDDQADGGADDDVLELGSGDDRGWGGEGNDLLLGGAGEDRLSGGGGDDAVQGQGGSDRLWGGSGSDVLEGGSGSDQFNGGGDADRLVLDGGSDTAWGGDGADVFVAGAGADVIKDFQDGDRIDLSPFFTSFGAVERRMSLDGDHVVIDLPGNGNTLTVERVGTLDRGDLIL